MLSGIDPDVEWRTDPLAPDAGTYRGHEGVLALLDDWTTTFDDLRVEADEIIEVDRDRLIVCARFIGNIKGTRSPVVQPFAEIVTLRDGRLWRVEDFPGKAEALEAMGLGE
jgi:ketosteroid isomerase-like protein